jgi:ABC-2 type transport system permease protein/ribosome-dependent ATPase
MNMRRILVMVSKEWRETARDRTFLTLAFLIPLVWMIVFGYGMVFDVEHIPYAVFDQDQSAMSRDYLSRFQQSRYFAFQGAVGSAKEMEALLARGTVRAVIVVPEQFQEQLREGRSVAVQTLLDGTFPLRSDITKGYVIAINADFSQELLVQYLARLTRVSVEQARRLMEPVRLEVRYLYNQEVRSAWTIAPSLVMLVLSLSPPLLSALGIVREKERGSIYNIYSSTATPVEFLIGKLFPYVVISSINVSMLWLLAVYVFGAPFKGSLLFFFFASVLFILCTTGIGLVVSMFVRTQQAALIITLLISIIPTINYSGMLVPVSSLTGGAWLLSHLFPAMYYTNIIRGTFLKGVGLDVLWPDVLILALYAAALRVAAHQLFTKRPAA